MSELTPCNFCTLQRIKQRTKAKGDGSRVVVLGSDVYVVPKGVAFSELPRGDVDKKTGKGAYSVAWLMEIPKRCCC